MKPIISIIVPVYNVEKYLKTCLDSVIKQTVKDIEILVIDDGSTDTGGRICDSYSEVDPRIRVFHKENGGLSSARNFGLALAKGDFIGFVDSDDYIEEDMYETLLTLIKKYDADMAMCGLYDMFDGKPRKVFQKKEEIVAGKAEAIKMVMEAEIVSVTAVNKLYDRKLFDTVRYPEGKTAEDAFVILDLLEQCDKVAITTEQKYYYIHRGSSITTERFSKKNLDAIEAYEKNYQLIREKHPELLNEAKMRLCWSYFYVLDRLILDESGEHEDLKEDVTHYLKENMRFILENKRFTKSRKMAALLLLLGNTPYKKCVQLQNRRYRTV